MTGEGLKPHRWILASVLAHIPSWSLTTVTTGILSVTPPPMQRGTHSSVTAAGLPGDHFFPLDLFLL